MRIYLCKYLTASILAAAVLSMTPAVPAAKRSAGGENSSRSDRQVSITADRLVSDRSARTATFTGRVKVVRGDNTIESDRLTVVYGARAPRTDAASPGISAIERIIAEGNVRIRSKELSARTPKAIYSRPAQTIELVGDGSQVTSGSNSITGRQIVLYLEGDRLTVSSGADHRVKAVIEPSTQ